jgi:hypothetical protein
MGSPKFADGDALLRRWVDRSSPGCRTLPDGSELVMLRESDGMCARRRRDTRTSAAGRF